MEIVRTRPLTNGLWSDRDSAARLLKGARDDARIRFRSKGIQPGPANSLQLSTYRHAALHAEMNANGVRKKLVRARSFKNKARWSSAVRTWSAIASYFSQQIKDRCGEPF